MNPLGMVLGSREVGALDFWVAVQEGEYLRLDDMVFASAKHPNPRVGMVRYYGMVDQVVKFHEGSQFDTDVFLAQKQLLPVSTSFAAHVKITRLEPEEYLPPDPGSLVYRAEGETLEKALYYDRMNNHRGSTKLPVGLLKNGEVAYVNLEFLNGVKGGHVNISGISGVATKTSYATFLLYSLFNSGVLADAANARALVFNVKGEDLFFLDKQSNRLTAEEKARYHALGLPDAPFRQVSFRAPPKPTAGDLMPNMESRKRDVDTYHWDLAQFCREGLLPFLFTDRGAMTNLGFLIDQIAERLRKLADGQKGPYLVVEDWDDPESLGEQGITFDALGKARLSNFGDLVRYIEYKLLGLTTSPLSEADDAEPKGADPRWVARQARGTLEAFVRRLRASLANVHTVVRGDRPGNPPDPLASTSQLTVIDIHQLQGQAQMFVVGSILKKVFEKKERSEFAGRVFIVLDELNKYAPREDQSPIKDILLDIAERGRSLGVILIGAQQTASEVERRIVANAAIRVVGRLDAAEAERPEYRYLPPSFLQRAVILPQGTMIVQQPELPVPLPLTFPIPAWATKAEEALIDNSTEALEKEFGL